MIPAGHSRDGEVGEQAKAIPVPAHEAREHLADPSEGDPENRDDGSGLDADRVRVQRALLLGGPAQAEKPADHCEVSRGAHRQVLGHALDDPQDHGLEDAHRRLRGGRGDRASHLELRGILGRGAHGRQDDQEGEQEQDDDERHSFHGREDITSGAGLPRERRPGTLLTISPGGVEFLHHIDIQVECRKAQKVVVRRSARLLFLLILPFDAERSLPACPPRIATRFPSTARIRLKRTSSAQTGSRTRRSGDSSRTGGVTPPWLPGRRGCCSSARMRQRWQTRERWCGT